MDGYCRYLLVSYGWCALNGRKGVEKVGRVALDLACWHGSGGSVQFSRFFVLEDVEAVCVWVR